MTTEIDILIQQLNNNPATGIYLGQVFPQLDASIMDELSKSIQLSISRYAKYLPEETGKIDTAESLKLIFNKFPFFIFTITHLLNLNPKNQPMARRLFIAGILAVQHCGADSDARVRFFLQDLDDRSDLQALNNQVFASDEDDFNLPKQIYMDMISFCKNQFKFAVTKNLHELIEIQFCFLGIYQLFLRYFFELLAASPQDTISLHLSAIYSRLFILIRLEELKYWKNYANQDVLKNKLEQIIQLNSPHKRHPILRKDLFNRLLDYHPIIHDGSVRRISVRANELLRSQLDALTKMSVVELKLFLNIIHKLKGGGHVVYLITHLAKAAQDKLNELQKNLEQSESAEYESLTMLVISLVERLLARPAEKRPNTINHPKKIAYSQSMIRKLDAKRNLAKMKNKDKMMTQDDVAQYLKDWLENLYRRARIEGALTFDQLPQYLAQFSIEAKPLMSQISEGRRQELVDAFNAATDQILEDFAKEEGVSKEKAEEVKTAIHAQMEELKSPVVEERAEIAEDAEMKPADSREKSEKKEANPNFDKILKTEKITIGFDDKSPRMALADFFTLPLGGREGPDESDWFESHKRYIKLAVEKEVIKPVLLDSLDDITAQLPKQKYKKYFNIFTDEELEETTLFAVHDVWFSGALHNLKV